MADEIVEKRVVRPVLRPAQTIVLRLAWAVFATGVVIVAFGTILAPHDDTEINLLARLRPPFFAGGTWEHVLGTDDLGRDILSRVIMSVRVSIFIAITGTIIGATVGTVLGFLAAYFRGVVDDGLQMLIDMQAALPYMLVALVAVAIFGVSFNVFVLVVGFYGWERYARLARGLALDAQTRGYVVSLHTVNASPVRIYGRHILPNVASTLLVSATLGFPEIILLESALSFLGLGVQPPASSLGSMLGEGREYLLSAWWMAMTPGLIIVAFALAVNIIGDDLRDRLDPRK